MQSLNVQVHDELFEDVLWYAKRYHISRAAAVSCLLSYALDQLKFEIQQLRSEQSAKRGGSG
jgi:hypothetical protein